MMRRLRSWLRDREVRLAFRGAIRPVELWGWGRHPPLWPPMPPRPAPPRRGRGVTPRHGHRARGIYSSLPARIETLQDAHAAYKGCMKLGSHFTITARAIAQRMGTLQRLTETEHAEWEERWRSARAAADGHIRRGSAPC